MTIAGGCASVPSRPCGPVGDCMTDRTPLRTGAVALMASGCASILFWIMAAWTGTFAGAAVVQQAAWIPAQTLHVIAALLAVFGFMSVYAAERHRAGLSGLIA